MHTIGIDFGTTKTLVTRLNTEYGLPVPIRLGMGTDYIPTAVYIDDNGQMYFGEDADERVTDPTGTYIPRFKMKLGSATPLAMCFTPDGDMVRLTALDLVREYLLFIRRRVENKVFMAEDSVSGAVITRPVNFSPAQLDELKSAAHAAGFKEVQLTTEPEAAGLAFCRLNAAKAFKRSALVVDWGGGTLDFALVTRDGDTIRTHPRLTDGDTTMGGEHFDDLIRQYAEMMLRKQGDFKINAFAAGQKIRRAKERLSVDTEIPLRLSHSGGVCDPIPLTRRLFNQLIIEAIEKAAQKVKELIARIPATDKPEMLLLVGGSCQIPLIKTTLETTCGLPAYDWDYSREAVGLGAALWGQKLPGAPATPAPALAPIPASKIATAAPTSAPEENAAELFKKGKNYYFGKNTAKDYTQAAYYFTKAAKMGHAAAQCNLGILYEDGNGVPQDYAQAAYWYHKAAEQGNADAQNNLGLLYEAGNGVPQDYGQAAHWYHKAAEQGDADAQCNLGILYEDGNGVPQDYAQAAYWYHKAAEQDNARAQCNLGILYENGHGVPQDYNQAAHWYRQAAEQDNAGAQCNLGILYEDGHGVPQDYNQAAHWYRQAAEQDNAGAQYFLGSLYEDGHGVPQDYTQAAHWYRQAAEQGDAYAQLNLGLLYANGKGVPQDYNQAAHWYRQAAEQEIARAQCNLGALYEFGDGVPQDYSQAAHWYYQAAEQEYTDAQYYLGILYEYGHGVPQDYPRAAYWYHKAAEQGDADAQYSLGILYVYGHGVPQDYARAAEWLRLAAAQDNEEAQKALARLSSYLG